MATKTKTMNRVLELLEERRGHHSSYPRHLYLNLNPDLAKHLRKACVYELAGGVLVRRQKEWYQNTFRLLHAVTDAKFWPSFMNIIPKWWQWRLKKRQARVIGFMLFELFRACHYKIPVPHMYRSIALTGMPLVFPLWTRWLINRFFQCLGREMRAAEDATIDALLESKRQAQRSN